MNIFNSKIILDQFLYHWLIHDKIDQGDIFYFYKSFCNLVRNIASLIAHNLGDAKKCCLQRGRARCYQASFCNLNNSYVLFLTDLTLG